MERGDYHTRHASSRPAGATAAGGAVPTMACPCRRPAGGRLAAGWRPACQPVDSAAHWPGAGRLFSCRTRDPASFPLVPRDSTCPAKEVLMNLTISGHHLEVTPALKEYVLTKLERVTRHFDQVVDVNVLLTVEKLKEKERRQKCEVTLHVKGRDIFVEQTHEDLYAAIDQLMDKLDRQVVRHKDRLQEHHHQASKRLHADSA
jgi:putative sigma-54 modulation protein